MSFAEIKTVEDACRAMIENTHSLLTREGVEHILRPFHLDGRIDSFVRNYKADGDRNPKGLTLNDRTMKEALGAATFDLAPQICNALNLKYASCIGRGFQVRACVEAIRTHYGEARFQ